MSDLWRHNAACEGHTTAWWFPDRNGPRNKVTKAALAICRSCPVQTQCLTHAQDEPELHGIWGGLTPEQRRGLRRTTVTIAHGTRSGYAAELRYGRIPCAACKQANADIQTAQRRIRERARTRD